MLQERRERDFPLTIFGGDPRGKAVMDEGEMSKQIDDSHKRLGLSPGARSNRRSEEL